MQPSFDGYMLVYEISFTINNPRILSHAYGAPSSLLFTVEDNSENYKLIKEKCDL